MQVIHTGKPPQKWSQPHLAIGFFDGFHRGHQALVERLVDGAKIAKTPMVVVTFSPHPSHIIPGATPVPIIFDRKDLEGQLRLAGVDGLWVIPFTKEFSKSSHQSFCDELLGPMNPGAIVVGSDFKFGAGAKGDCDFLQKWASSQRIRVNVLSKVFMGEREISSTWVRESLKKGDVELTRELLGRFFSLLGLVAEGKKLGRRLGFPTANIVPTAKPLIKPGVYFGQVEAGAKLYPAVCNLGIKPTVEEAADLTLECHLLNFSGDLYGQEIKFYFHRRIRDEMKFESVDQLKEQIAKDVALSKVWAGI